MNKKIQIITSMILLILMFGVQVSYAISGTNNENGFFSVNSEEIAQKETLKITFDLNKIEYDNFKIVLNSNINNNELFTDDNVTINEESNAVVINIDKSKLNLNKIEMSYVVPENAEINSKIQLNAKIVVEEELESQDDEGNVTTTKQEKTVLEENKNVTIVKKSKNESENENKDAAKTDDVKPENEASSDKKQNDSKENENQDSKKQEESNKPNNAQAPTSNSNSNSNNKSNVFSNNSSNKSMITVTTKNGENKETATYNGSKNNYLKKLKVKGISLNTKFNKENTTYFINVTDTSSLKITATAEDDDAKVVITGNDNIKQGTNKILIAVTAENGDVRYYRIFVNCTEN